MNQTPLTPPQTESRFGEIAGVLLHPQRRSTLRAILSRGYVNRTTGFGLEAVIRCAAALKDWLNVRFADKADVGIFQKPHRTDRQYWATY